MLNSDQTFPSKYSIVLLQLPRHGLACDGQIITSWSYADDNLKMTRELLNGAAREEQKKRQNEQPDLRFQLFVSEDCFTRKLLQECYEYKPPQVRFRQRSKRLVKK